MLALTVCGLARLSSIRRCRDRFKMFWTGAAWPLAREKSLYMCAFDGDDDDDAHFQRSPAGVHVDTYINCLLVRLFSLQFSLVFSAAFIVGYSGSYYYYYYYYLYTRI